MRVAIVENTAITHHGQIGVALHERAALIDIYRPWRDGILPARLAHDALIVLGGEQNALADATHPYLPALADLMAHTAAADRAVLGICLGSQILARGLGLEAHVATHRCRHLHRRGSRRVKSCRLRANSPRANPVSRSRCGFKGAQVAA